MAVQQTLPRRYIDREKLAGFWRTNDDFKGKPCGIIVSRPVNVGFQLALRERFSGQSRFVCYPGPAPND